VDLTGIPGSNLSFLQDGALRLKGLGFRHLRDYEIPHFQKPNLRLASAGFVSEDGTTFATLTQRFAPLYNEEYYSFTTWCRSGHRLVSTGSTAAGAQLIPEIHYLLAPRSRDPESMLRRHRRTLEQWTRRGEEPIPVRTPEDHARVIVEAFDVEIQSLVRRGYSTIVGEEVRSTEKFVRSGFWRGLSPVRRGFPLLYHLAGIGIPAVALAATLAALSATMIALGWPLSCLAGFLLGWIYGYFFWQHATFWCLILPFFFFLAHPAAHGPRFPGVALAAFTAASALVAMQLGYVHNASHLRRSR
jgi:hypothetical protein